jgi:hypothetical protein
MTLGGSRVRANADWVVFLLSVLIAQQPGVPVAVAARSVSHRSYANYSVDGSAYVVTSTRRVEGAAVKRLFETLRRAPMWPPRS